MSQHLSVHLTDQQRHDLDTLIKKGHASARTQTRARILLLADRSQAEQRTHQQIADALLCSTPTVGQVCRRFAQEGMTAAISERPRPGQAPKITGEIEAQLVLLACSAPPEGKARWTFKLLADKLVELALVPSISEVAVYKRLKKRTQALEGQVLVHCQSVGSVCGQDGGRSGRVCASF
jgi:putative transposase